VHYHILRHFSLHLISQECARNWLYLLPQIGMSHVRFPSQTGTSRSTQECFINGDRMCHAASIHFLTNLLFSLFLSFDVTKPTNMRTEKVKQSHYRPGESLRVPGSRGSQIYRQLAHEGGKVVSPKHRPPLPLRKYS
jgi:hypothetical protein